MDIKNPLRILSVLAALLAAACGSEGSLIVQIRTNLSPGRQFTQMRTTITDESGEVVQILETPAADQPSWTLGVRAAELDPLPDGRYRVVVDAMQGTSPVIRRPARVHVEGGLAVVTILVTGDCIGITCDDPAAPACLGGVCVSEGCTEETPEECPPPECVEHSECPTSGCASAECTASGTCFYKPEGGCDGASVCQPDVGCVPCTDFSAPAPQIEVNMGAEPRGAAFGPNGLELFYSSGGLFIRAKRTSREEPFFAPDPVELGLRLPRDPTLSPDGFELFVISEARMGDDPDIYRLTRPDLASPFGAARLIDSLLTGDSETGPSLSSDGLELFFVRERDGMHIWRATRPSVDAAFENIAPVAELRSTGADFSPEIGPFGRELWFSSNRDGPTSLYLAIRPSPDEAFGPAVRVDALSTDGLELDPAVSPDGLTLLFTRDDGRSVGLYASTRMCR